MACFREIILAIRAHSGQGVLEAYMSELNTQDLHPEIWKRFDRYVHGLIDRRGFLDGTAQYAGGSMTAVGILEAPSPRCAEAQIQVHANNSRVGTERVEIASPDGNGMIRALVARPAGATGRIPTVVVIHENRGLNPHIEDVVRRAAVAGFMAIGPDALTSLGGYPGTDEAGVEMQRKLEQPKMMADFLAAVRYVKGRSDSTGCLGAVGFCFGGQPQAKDVPKIRAALLIHYAENDDRINSGWPAYEAALNANRISHQQFTYPGTPHGCHNDTTPRFNREAAALAWARTIALFQRAPEDSVATTALPFGVLPCGSCSGQPLA